MAIPACHVVFVPPLPVFRDDILVVTQVKQCPKVLVAPEDDMSTPAAIAAIRPCLGIEFGPHEMLAACTTVSAFAKHPDLVYKI
jgi:hypothetical protein